MKIQLISGRHLTDGQKKSIKAIIQAGLTTAKVGRQNYHVLSNPNGTTTVTICRNDRGLGFIGEPLRTSCYKSIIQVTND